jgi:monoamine oxidase
VAADPVREADYVVVGGGLAGLAAAGDLIAAGASVALLEARERVGGRTLNEDLGDGKVVEVGGQWIGPTQDRIAALAAEVGVDTFPTYTAGENVLERSGRISRYRGTIPRLNPLALVDVEVAQRRLNRLARRVSAQAPWETPGAAALDSQTVATWMRRNMRTRLGRSLLELGIEAVWAAEPEDLSLLHMLFYIRSAGGLDLLFDTEGGAQERRFVGGSQLVSIRLAERLGDAVVLGAPVRRIEQSAAGVFVQADGLVVRARRAIVAIAPPLAARIAYGPPMPGHRDQLTQHMPLGTVAKCMAIYDEPFWRAQGLSGQGLSLTGPIRLTYDNSPPDGSPGVLLGFLEGRHARNWGQATPADRRDAVLRTFTTLFGPRAASPERYVERLWAEEEWTRGCYGCHLPPGAWTAYGSSLWAPVGRIHWAGAETATVWNGYMDGAVSSGERAAAEVLEAEN